MPRSSASRADLGGFNPEDADLKAKEKKTPFSKPTELDGIVLSPTKKKEVSPLEKELNEAARKRDAQPKSEPKPTVVKIRGTSKEAQKAREVQAGTHFDRIAKAVLTRNDRDPKTDLPFFKDLKGAILERSAKQADVEAQMVKTMNELVKTDKEWDQLVDNIAKRSGYKDTEVTGRIAQELNDRKVDIIRSALATHDIDSKKPIDLDDAVDLAMAHSTREIKIGLREQIGSPAVHEKLVSAITAVELLQATQDSELDQDEEMVIELEDDAHKAIDAWALAVYEDNKSITPDQLTAKAKQSGFDKLITKTRFDKLIRNQKAEHSRRLAEADEVRTKGPKLEEIDPIDDIVAEHPDGLVPEAEDPYAYAKDIVDQMAPDAFTDDPSRRAKIEHPAVKALVDDGSDGGTTIDATARAAKIIKRQEDRAAQDPFAFARGVEKRMAPDAFVDDLDGAGLDQRAIPEPVKPLSPERQFFGRGGEDLEGDPKRYQIAKPKGEPAPKTAFQRLADAPRSIKAALFGGLATLGAMFVEPGQNREDLPESTPYADVTPDDGGMTMNDDESVAEYAAGREVKIGDMGKVSAGDDAGGVEIDQASKQQLERRAQRAEAAQKKAFEALIQDINEASDQFEFDTDEATLKLADLLGTQGLKLEAAKIKAKRWAGTKELLNNFDTIIQQQEDAKVRAELAERAQETAEGLRAMLAEKAAEKEKIAHDKKVAQDQIDRIMGNSGL